MARPEVIVDDHFREFERDLGGGVARALARVAAAGAEAAATADLRGYKIGGIVSQTRAGSVVDDGRSWQVPIVNRDFRAAYFDSGTLGYRTRKVKRPRNLPTTTKQGKKRGIRPVRFMTVARKHAAALLMDELRRELS